MDAFNFIEEVKVRGGGCDGTVGGVRARHGTVVVAGDGYYPCFNLEVRAEVVEEKGTRVYAQKFCPVG